MKIEREVPKHYLIESFIGGGSIGTTYQTDFEDENLITVNSLESNGRILQKKNTKKKFKIQVNKNDLK